MSTFGHRFAAARKRQGLKVPDLAKSLGISERSIRNYETGTTSPSVDVVQHLAESLGVTVGYLINGDGFEETGAQSETSSTKPNLSVVRTSAPDLPPQADDLVTYPYAPHGHKGGWAGRSNAGMEGTEMITLSRSFLVARLGRVPDPDRTYWTHVVGDSMMPWLRDGQMIGVERDEQIRSDGRHALYLDDAEEEIVKRVSRLGGRRLKLSADNLNYGSQEIQHLEDDMYRDVSRGHTLRMRVLGRVIEPPDDAASIFATAVAAVRGFTA